MSYFSGLSKSIKNENKKPKMAKSKVWAIVLTIVASIGYFALFTNLLGFLKYFLLGTFGVFAYILFTAMFLMSGMILRGKKYNITARYAILLAVSLVSILAIFHLAFSGGADMSSYGAYLADIYNMQNSIGGVLLGLLVFPFKKLLGIGAYFLFAIVLVICVTLIYNTIVDEKSLSKVDSKFLGGRKKQPQGVNTPVEKPAQNLRIEINEKIQKEDTPVVLDAEIKKEESAREIARRKLGLDRLENGDSLVRSSSTNQLDTFNKNYMNAGGKVFSTKQTQSPISFAGTFGYNNFDSSTTKTSQTDEQKYQEYLKFMGLKNDVRTEATVEKPAKTEVASQNDFATSSANLFSTSPSTTMSYNQTNYGFNTNSSNSFGSNLDGSSNQETNQNGGTSQTFKNNFETDMSTEKNDEKIFGSKTTKFKFDYSSPTEKSDFLDKLSSSNQNDEIAPSGVSAQAETVQENNLGEIFDNNLSNEGIELPKSFQNNTYSPISKFNVAPKNPIDSEIEERKNYETKIDETPKDAPRQKIKEYKYTRPTLDLLSCVSTDPNSYGGNYEETGRKIEGVLEEFKIPAKIIGITRGPAVTRYELEMPVGISVNKIPALEGDIAMRIATSKKIMIQAPIPGMSAFGIEVPNDKVATVSLREILSNEAFKNHKSPCAFALGKEINGVIDVCAVNKMPHVLIAGSTGSGKSVCLNSLILSILYKSSPEDVKFILIDPKRVEFSIYQGLPHLVIPDIISEPRKADNALGWAIKEMEKRYALLEQHRVRNIEEYNNMQDVKDRYIPKMPYIIIIMDEFADMMQSDCKDIENKVSKLAAKARAAGIHLVLATQRPSVDVLSGTAKNNFPARIAFFLTSQTDSRTILGYSGAENLLGKGDMLYVAPGSNEGAKRIQGCFVSDEEVKNVVEFVINHNKVEYDDSIEEEINKKKDADSVNPDGSFSSYDDDEEAEMESYAKDVLKEFIRVGRASASYIQRVKRVGFNKASRILAYLAKKKYISEGDGSAKPRAVYITKQQYIELFGETDFDDHD